MSKLFSIFTAVVVVAGSAALSFSDSGISCCTTAGCPHCGCCRFRKVCVPVKDVKKETTFEYSCKCEDFCVPGPSKCVGTRCEPDCGGCPKCCKMMMPTCAQVRSRCVLVKTPVTKETCTIKWVVKTVCCGCGNGCGSCCDPACGGAVGCAAPGCAALDCDQVGYVPSAAYAPPMAPTEVQVGHSMPVQATSTDAASFPGRLFRDLEAAIPR